MERLIKNLFMIFVRFIIMCVIIIVIIALLELILKSKNKNNDINNQGDYLSHYYTEYNNIVNRINAQKIPSGFWNYNATDYSVIKYNEEIPAKTNKKRILVVGDSFVWGWAQDNLNNLWWKQLSYMLKQNSYQDVEIVAAGMNGFSIVDETEKIILNQDYINKIQPDLIIVAFVYNDWEIMDEKDEYFVSDLKEKFDEQAYIAQNLNQGIIKKMGKIVPNTQQKILQLLMQKEYAKEEFKSIYGYSYNEKKKLYLSDSYIDRIEQRAVIPLSKMDIPTIVVNLPFEENFPFVSVEFKEKVFELLDKYKVKNYDMKEEYDENFSNLNYMTDLQVNIADYHPNARLMNFYCKEIYKILQQNYPDILGKQTEKFSSHNFVIQDTLPDNIPLQKIGKNKYELEYKTDWDMLYYPYSERKYIKLNLEYPTPINKLHLQTQNINDLQITVDLYNEQLGYEDEKSVPIDLVQLENNEYIGQILKQKKVTSINISGSPLTLENRKIVLEVE